MSEHGAPEREPGTTAAGFAYCDAREAEHVRLRENWGTLATEVGGVNKLVRTLAEHVGKSNTSVLQMKEASTYVAAMDADIRHSVEMVKGMAAMIADINDLSTQIEIERARAQHLQRAVTHQQMVERRVRAHEERVVAAEAAHAASIAALRQQREEDKRKREEALVFLVKGEEQLRQRLDREQPEEWAALLGREEEGRHRTERARLLDEEAREEKERLAKLEEEQRAEKEALDAARKLEAFVYCSFCTHPYPSSRTHCPLCGQGTPPTTPLQSPADPPVAKLN